MDIRVGRAVSEAELIHGTAAEARLWKKMDYGLLRR